MSTLEDRIQQLELENAELREKLSRKGAGRRPLGKQRMSAAEYRARHKAKMLEAAKQEEEARNAAIRAARPALIDSLIVEILPTIHTDEQMRVMQRKVRQGGPSGTPEALVAMTARFMNVETDYEAFKARNGITPADEEAAAQELIEMEQAQEEDYQEIKRRERAAEVDRLAATLALSTTITGYEPEHVTVEIEPEVTALVETPAPPKPFAVVMCGCQGCAKCFLGMGSDECQRYAKFPVLEPIFCFECFEPGKEPR